MWHVAVTATNAATTFNIATKSNGLVTWQLALPIVTATNMLLLLLLWLLLLWLPMMLMIRPINTKG